MGVLKVGSTLSLILDIAHLLRVVLDKLVHLLHRRPSYRHGAAVGSRRDAVRPGRLCQKKINVKESTMADQGSNRG